MVLGAKRFKIGVSERYGAACLTFGLGSTSEKVFSAEALVKIRFYSVLWFILPISHCQNKEGVL
jgi:hypothetical protein